MEFSSSYSEAMRAAPALVDCTGKLLKAFLLLLLLVVLPFSPFVIDSGGNRRKRVSEELLVAPVFGLFGSLTADECVVAAASSFLPLFALKFCL